MRHLVGLGVVVGVLASGQTARAQLVIADFSPDTSGAACCFTGWWFNRVGVVVDPEGSISVTDVFILTDDVFVSGGSIFSSSPHGAIGDPVLFEIRPDASGAPSVAPVISVTASLDAVDTTLTTTAPLMRKHATIAPTFIPAGTYWFAMPGVDFDVGQGSSDPAAPFGDGPNGLAFTSPFGISGPHPGVGDMYFTVEGTADPSDVLLMANQSVMGLNLQPGTETSLLAHLDVAAKLLTDANDVNDRAAAGALQAFVNHLNAYPVILDMAGNPISEEEVAALSEMARQIIMFLEA